MLRRTFYPILILAALTLVAPCATADPTVIYSDDFESYATGAHPLDWDELRGVDDETVTDFWAASPTQSLVSVTTDGSILKRPYLDLDDLTLWPLPNCLAYQATLHMPDAPESSAALGFFFADPRYPGEARAENAVLFRLDGSIWWYGPVSEQIGSWTPGDAATHTVRVVIDFTRLTAAVSLDSVEIASGLTAWPKSIPASSPYGAEIPLDQFGFSLAETYSGTASAAVLIDDLSLESCIVPLDADVKVRPRTINLKSRGRFLTGFVKLPVGYFARDINLSTVYITYGDCDPIFALPKPSSARFGRLMVKFPRSDVHEILPLGQAVVISIGGELNDGTPFAGSDINRVICPGKCEHTNCHDYKYKEKHNNGNGN